MTWTGIAQLMLHPACAFAIDPSSLATQAPKEFVPPPLRQVRNLSTRISPLHTCLCSSMPPLRLCGHGGHTASKLQTGPPASLALGGCCGCGSHGGRAALKAAAVAAGMDSAAPDALCGAPAGHYPSEPAGAHTPCYSQRLPGSAGGARQGVTGERAQSRAGRGPDTGRLRRHDGATRPNNGLQGSSVATAPCASSWCRAASAARATAPCKRGRWR